VVKVREVLSPLLRFETPCYSIYEPLMFMKIILIIMAHVKKCYVMLKMCQIRLRLRRGKPPIHHPLDVSGVLFSEPPTCFNRCQGVYVQRLNDSISCKSMQEM